MRNALFAIVVFIAQVVSAQQLNYYFGNLHAHTAFSDGNKDSVASGVFDPAGSYAYAKLSQNLDFLGISEHNHYSTAHNPGFRRQLYQAGLQQADAANEENNFLTLFGMEYGVLSDYNGHVVIYGYNQLIGWESSAPGVTGNNYDVYNLKTDYNGLFRKIKAVPGAFCYLAHPSFSDFSTAGTWETALANAPYVADYDSVIVGMPLRSGVAMSSASNYADYSLGNYFDYYKKILNQGYHLGIGYDHDNHYTNFGRSNAGRLVILAPSLTRANLYSAMRSRRFYGSDDPNAKVAFTVNGYVMGSIVKGEGYPVINVAHNDADGETADSIKIWKGWANSGGLWAHLIHTTLQSNTCAYVDDYNVNTGIEYYYFAEIRQADGQWIVTSPVWYTASSIASAPAVAKEDAVFAFDAISRNLDVSFSMPEMRTYLLTDVAGKKVLCGHMNDRDTRISLADVPAGIYFLRIDGASSVVKKVAID